MSESFLERQSQDPSESSHSSESEKLWSNLEDKERADLELFFRLPNDFSTGNSAAKWKTAIQRAHQLFSNASDHPSQSTSKMEATEELLKEQFEVDPEMKPKALAHLLEIKLASNQLPNLFEEIMLAVFKIIDIRRSSRVQTHEITLRISH